MDQHKKEEFKRSIGELYPRLHRAMSAYLAGSSVESEDILQETFLKAYRNITHLKISHHFTPGFIP